ncbi:hypothetical protein BDAP_002669 [Binucleata daphniae]
MHVLMNMHDYKPILCFDYLNPYSMKSYIDKYYNNREDSTISSIVLNVLCFTSKNTVSDMITAKNDSEDFYTNLVSLINGFKNDNVFEIRHIWLRSLTFYYINYNHSILQARNKNKNSSMVNMRVQLFCCFFVHPSKTSLAYINPTFYIYTKYIKWLPLFLWICEDFNVTDFSIFVDKKQFLLAIKTLNDANMAIYKITKNKTNKTKQIEKIKTLCQTFTGFIVCSTKILYKSTNKFLKIKFEKIKNEKHKYFVTDQDLLLCLKRCILIANYIPCVYFYRDKEVIICAMKRLLRNITLEINVCAITGHKTIQYKNYTATEATNDNLNNYINNINILKQHFREFYLQKCKVNENVVDILQKMYFKIFNM